MNDSAKIVVSIICKTYNHEKYVREALDGFVNQKTSFAYEIIVHDDASTDGTQEIIKEYEKKYPGIFNNIYQIENQMSKGNKVWRSLCKKAKGKYIAVCEGDDYWTDEHKLEKQIMALESNPDCVACCCNELVIDGNGVPYESQELYYEKSDVKHDVSFLYNYCKFSHTAGLVMLKSILPDDDDDKTDDFYNLKVNGDMKWAALIAVHGKMYHIAQTMAVYRCVKFGNDSWTARNYGKNIYLSTYQQLERLRSYFAEYYSFQISYQGYYDKITRSAILLYIRSRTLENKNIATTLFSENPHKITFLLKMNVHYLCSLLKKVFSFVKNISKDMEGSK